MRWKSHGEVVNPWAVSSTDNAVQLRVWGEVRLQGRKDVEAWATEEKLNQTRDANVVMDSPEGSLRVNTAVNGYR